MGNRPGSAHNEAPPHHQSKQPMGGFWVIQAPDLDAALAWARDGSAACRGPVEVRPFQEEPDA